MPNWCANRARFFHEDAQKVRDLKASLDKEVFFGFICPIGEWDYCNAVNAWSTKWEASNTCSSMPYDGDHRLDVDFESAWNPPTQVYEKMVLDGWQVEAFFLEGGMGFIGKYSTGTSTLHEDFYNFTDPLPPVLLEEFDLNSWYEGSGCQFVLKEDGFYHLEVEGVEHG